MAAGDTRGETMLGSEAHHSAVAFARGGLVCLFGLLLPATLVGLVGGGAARTIGPWLRILIPAAAFALSGLVGAASLGGPGRVQLGFAASYALAATLVVPGFTRLEGLTGFEPMRPVLLVVVPAFGAGFAVAGGLGAWLAGARGSAVRVLILVFGGAGVAGGLCAAVPYLLAVGHLTPGSEWLRLGVGALTSIGAFVVPNALGGAVAGSLLGAARGNTGSGTAEWITPPRP
jgi:hypothetical protein